MEAREIDNKKISVVIPTYNERENVVTLIEQIHQVMTEGGYEYECIVVDDNSPDGTFAAVEEIREKYEIQAFLRTEERGLSSAMLFGAEKARGGIIGFIDADLQHPPQVMPDIVRPIVEEGYQLVVGSRVISGGGVEDWPWYRRLVSWLGRMLARPLTPIRDTMSGYFFLRREVLQGTSLRTIGYKLGLEIMVKGNHQGKVLEVPYVFQNRQLGSSKLDWKTHIAYLWQVVLLYLYKVRILS